MKTEINGRQDIEFLINSFYEKIKTDSMLGPFFAHVNWSKHLPVMYLFWENALFYTGGYAGNPLKTHQLFHSKHPLNQEHFKRWEEIFTNTVDEYFEGEKAELIKQRAISISTVMQVKIL